MDITKCAGTACPLKHNCVRFSAPPGEHQYYFSSTPYSTDKNKCEFFIDNNIEPDHKIYIGKNSKP